jgi:hypothetical protein
VVKLKTGSFIMSNVKKFKKEIQLSNKDEEVQPVSPQPTLDESLKVLISFDAYFSKMMKEKSHVLLHHKAPMREFARAKGLKDTASIEDFDRIFEQY